MAVIDRGRILLVEGKDRLLERQGGEDPAHLPGRPGRGPAGRPRGARGAPRGGGTAIDVDALPGGSSARCSPPSPRPASRWGTWRPGAPSLEDVFVSILGSDEGGGAVNGLGVRTLFSKEMRRFLRVPGQTLLSPLITTSPLLPGLRLVAGQPHPGGGRRPLRPVHPPRPGDARRRHQRLPEQRLVPLRHEAAGDGGRPARVAALLRGDPGRVRGRRGGARDARRRDHVARGGAFTGFGVAHPLRGAWRCSSRWRRASRRSGS